MMKYTAQIWGSYWLCFALLMGAMHFAKLTVKDNRKWTETGIHGTLGARGFLREEPQSMISEAQSGKERENRQEVRKPLVAHDSWLITMPIDLN